MTVDRDAHDFVAPLRSWLGEDHEGRVMTLVEDGSFAEYVRRALDALADADVADADAARWERVANAAGAVIAEHLDPAAEEEHAFHVTRDGDGDLLRRDPRPGCLLCAYEQELDRSIWAAEEGTAE